MSIEQFFAFLQESHGAVENRSGGETGTSKIGKHTGEYQRGLAWFRYVNGRPDDEGLEGAGSCVVSGLQMTGAGNQNSGD